MFDAKIQTPISSKVLIKARGRAEEAGFSSVNDVIRIMLNQFAEGKIDFGLTLPTSQQSGIYISDTEQEEIVRDLKEIASRGEDAIVHSETVTL